MADKQDRFRTFFITINKSAECYQNAPSILKEYIGGDDYYAIIKHDKDIVNEDDILNWAYEKDEQFSQDSDAPILGTLKQEHYHVMIEFKNARTFKTIQNLLKGAHIKRPLSKVASYQYLIHKNHPNKYQYSKKEIQTNNFSYVNILISQNDMEPFDPNKILYYITNQKYKLKTLIEFYNKFGKQVNHYKNLINEMLNEYKNLNELEKYEIEQKCNYDENGEQI